MMQTDILHFVESQEAVVEQVRGLAQRLALAMRQAAYGGWQRSRSSV